MKRTILTYLLLIGCLTMQAQDFFVIEGKLKNVKDGLLLKLLRMEGGVGSTIAFDTIHDGHFRFKIESTDNQIEKLALLGRGDNFPNISLDVWVRPGCRVRITGNNNLIYTWQVKSDLEEQRLNQIFINDSRKLWDEYQENHLKGNALRSLLRNKESGESEKNTARKQLDSLERINDTTHIQINGNTIKRMKKMPINKIWLEQLEQLSLGVHYYNNYPYKEEVIGLYKQLPDEEKSTAEGKTIHVNLFPPTVANEGDEMADADLYDLEGKKHRLADYKGKYILLDFWSFGCGPCIMAFPEMKEVSELHKDKLIVISLSTDTKKAWEKASKEHNISWVNLNELEGSNGLYAKYGARGTPSYVVISPEGRVIKKWSGYGKSIIKLQLQRLLNAGQNVMSINNQNGHKTVNFPTVKKTTTEIHEIRQVILTDTATIIHIRGYYLPKYWIQLAKNIQLTADNGTVCPILRAEGIPLGERFFMPETGQADYTLYFAPLPATTRLFDLTEQEVAKPDRIEGIALTLP